MMAISLLSAAMLRLVQLNTGKPYFQYVALLCRTSLGNPLDLYSWQAGSRPDQVQAV
jgi:hypothetical protein